MYRTEVPLYGQLLQVVRDVDHSVLEKQGKQHDDLPIRNQLERHGAIRLGTAHELHMIKRLFAILGMHPVGYYDLQIVGFPLHGTAFRPTSNEALSRNPFRVFTTVLRRELLSPSVRELTDRILSKRNLFTPGLCKLMDRVEDGHVMTAQESEEFITAALKIFKWHSRATVPIEDYNKLKAEHPMVADIVCFPSSHINHLTPRTLDIDLAQQEMIRQGLPAKERVEGPPPRECPILLRQTSFKALEEPVEFVDTNGTRVWGMHTARFGEIEQRGAAVTRKGRDLYDQLLSWAIRNTANVSGVPLSDVLFNAFRRYPDTWEELRLQGLVYFHYSVSEHGKKDPSLAAKVSLSTLLSLGLVQYEPITYEDFLPFSAAGIFKSNLPDHPAESQIQNPERNVSELEGMLGCKVLDEVDFYDRLQHESIEECRKALGVDTIIMC